jgi:hypothetical protein
MALSSWDGPGWSTPMRTPTSPSSKLAVKKAEDRVAELAMKAKAADLRVQRATSARVRFEDERARS